MRRALMVLAVAGLLIGSAGAALAQDDTPDRPRGPGWGRGEREGPPPEMRERLRERWEKLSPEEKERFRERRERLAKERQGRRAPEQAERKRAEASPEKGRKAQKPNLPPRFKQWLKDMPPERRKQVLTRLKNASPEDRQRFLRRFAGERRQPEGRRPGLEQRPRRDGAVGRCPYCGAELGQGRRSAMRGGRGAQRQGPGQMGRRPGPGGGVEMRRRAHMRQMMRPRDFGGPRGWAPPREMRGRGYGPGPERRPTREQPMPWWYGRR